MDPALFQRLARDGRSVLALARHEVIHYSHDAIRDLHVLLAISELFSPRPTELVPTLGIDAGVLRATVEARADFETPVSEPTFWWKRFSGSTLRKAVVPLDESSSRALDCADVQGGREAWIGPEQILAALLDTSGAVRSVTNLFSGT